MEPNNFSHNSANVPVVEPPKPPKKRVKLFRYILKFIRKYWYLAVIVIFVIVGALAWWIMATNRAHSWEKATDYFAKADYEKAEEIIKNFSIPDDADRQRVYAQTMLATGNVDKALLGYEKLYETTRDDSARLVIGNIYNQKEEYDKAVKIYREIISSNPNNVQAYVNLSTTYKLQQKNEEAIKIASEAAKNNPRNVTLLELRVSMLSEDKESASYKEAVNNLREVNPEDPLLAALEQ